MQNYISKHCRSGSLGGTWSGQVWRKFWNFNIQMIQHHLGCTSMCFCLFKQGPPPIPCKPDAIKNLNSKKRQVKLFHCQHDHHDCYHRHNHLQSAIIWMIIMDLDDNLGQDELEQRHQELLARQRQLQEQYQVGFPWFVWSEYDQSMIRVRSEFDPMKTLCTAASAEYAAESKHNRSNDQHQGVRHRSQAWRKVIDVKRKMAMILLSQYTWYLLLWRTICHV